MAVSIVWSNLDGGSALASLAHGSGAAGATLNAQTIFLRHSGNNPITNCKLYVGEKAGSYVGAKTAGQDLSELLNWGNAVVSADFGGLQFNFNASGSFPDSSWSTVTSKIPTNGNVVRSGAGDSSDNGILLPTATGCPTIGTIPAGSTTGVRFQCRVQVPSSVLSTGKREFDLKLRYTFTS